MEISTIPDWFPRWEILLKQSEAVSSASAAAHGDNRDILMGARRRCVLRRVAHRSRLLPARTPSTWRPGAAKEELSRALSGRAGERAAWGQQMARTTRRGGGDTGEKDCTRATCT